MSGLGAAGIGHAQERKPGRKGRRGLRLPEMTWPSVSQAKRSLKTSPVRIRPLG
jgi:hypothetical protein